jgi:hypothetical protein
MSVPPLRPKHRRMVGRDVLAPTDIRVLFGAKRRDPLALLDQLTADE